MKPIPTKVPTEVSLHIKLSQLQQQRYQKKLYGFLHIGKELPMLKCYVLLISIILFSQLLLFISLTNIDIRLSLENMDRLRKLVKNCTQHLQKCLEVHNVQPNEKEVLLLLQGTQHEEHHWLEVGQLSTPYYPGCKTKEEEDG